MIPEDREPIPILGFVDLTAGESSRQHLLGRLCGLSLHFVQEEENFFVLVPAVIDRGEG